MPLDKQLVHIPLASGLDQRTDQKNIAPGKLTSLINGVFDKNGAIRKRKGSTAIGVNATAGALIRSSISAGAGIAALGDDLVVTDGDVLYSYSPVLNAGGTFGVWASRSFIPEPLVSRKRVRRFQVFPAPTVATQAFDVAGADCVYCNNAFVLTWVDNWDGSATPPKGDLKFLIVDASTGAELVGPILVDTAVSPGRLVVTGTLTYLVWAKGANIKNIVIDPANATPQIAVPTNIVTDKVVPGGATPDDFFDVCPLNATQFILAYEKNAGANRMVAAICNPAVVTSAVLTEAATGNGTIGIKATTGETLWYAYKVPGTGVRCAGMNPATLAQTVAPTTVMADVNLGDRIGVERVTATQCVIVANYDQSTTAPKMSHVQFNTAAAVTTVKNTFWTMLDTRPFAYNGRVYVGSISWHAGSNFTLAQGGAGTRYVMDLHVEDTTNTRPARVVGRYGCRISGGYFASGFNKGQSGPSSSTQVGTTGTFVSVGTTNSSVFRFSLDLNTIDFVTGNRYTNARAGKSLIFSTGAASFYDGENVYESGFNWPQTPTQVVGTSFAAGGLLSAGAYVWAIVATYIDKPGQVHRSAPLFKSGTALVNQKVTLTIPTVAMTERQTLYTGADAPITLEIYRTQVGGTTFNWLENYTANITSAATITYTDGASDVSIASNPLLYTTGGVISNQAPPSFWHVVNYRSRIVGIGDDRTQIWYTKAIVAGESANFADELILTMEDGGDFTALGVLDDKLILFKKNRIFYIMGDGPTDTNQASDYGVPTTISTDVGCVEPRSVVQTPVGLMFQGTKGIYLLDRSLAVSYLGKDVEDSLAQYPTVTSAVLLSDTQQVRFTCNAGGNTGITLMYDYLQNAWGVFQYFDSTFEQASASAASACLHQGVYKWITPRGTSFSEDSTTYRDGGAFGVWVTLSMETAWVKLSGIQGLQRIYRMGIVGDRYTSHDLQISIANDYQPTYAQTRTFLSYETDLNLFDQHLVHLQNQKGEAVRFKIEDAAPTGGVVGTGRGFSISSIVLQAGGKRGIFSLPQQARG